MPYGNSYIMIEHLSATTITPKHIPGPKDEVEIISKSLDNPIDQTNLRELLDTNSTVTLIVSDITRPCPTSKIVPVVVNRLLSLGVRKENIYIIFATGIHRRHTVGEWIKLLGVDIFNNFRVLDHDCRDFNSLSYLGKTSRGTPISINSLALNSDLKIAIANVDPHYFAGYSGGGKSILPGIASYESIKENHKMMLLPGAELGRIDGNPVRMDIEEAASMADLNFIVNVVLSESKEILGCFSGHFIKAHREAVKMFNELYGVEIGRKYDIVVASPGGYPKDINLYQAHKALEVAFKCVRPGGVIILLAECKEGIGENKTEEIIYSNMGPEDVINFIKEKFDLGYHKAYAIARIATKSEIVIVSNNIKESKLYKKANNVETAIKYGFELVGSGDVLILPYASSIIPKDLI
ncbi:MAG: nickel-dependent lactate racemase [Sulfolobales archaeon]|nr:nickel-dependent lactate racemase [Sulfolobales archaeon]MDW7969148.1 nickel-dependent lactate racemase [Sulfolobales archaeon]